ncbi:AraC family transcriptional regulator [Gimesia aquarii]|uniref:HTH-type transcriptional activator Btr n=1 Tax=Gimesia aquarii TaxID=2527964 RepID=A0A517WNP2_9PLAN|nr:AraC family transcriptional regulator [Gimesia aquarii]QDU06882.1 HTH-type transcriptional activator Btr [Gimesia aquarii]
MNVPLQQQFFKKVPGIEQTCRLFAHLPDVYLVVKDDEGRFIKHNQALLNWLKVDSDEELIGKTDFDIHPWDQAEAYQREDQRVMKSEEPLVDLVHPVTGGEGATSWFQVIKEPLFDKQRRVAGVVGMMRDYQRAGLAIAPYLEMQQVFDHIDDHFQREITVKELASLVELSTSQFQRRFRKLFNTSPASYINHVRIQSACRKLTSTTDTISHIAIQTGFYDHSHFSKVFKAYTGVSPTEYRRQ